MTIHKLRCYSSNLPAGGIGTHAPAECMGQQLVAVTYAKHWQTGLHDQPQPVCGTLAPVQSCRNHGRRAGDHDTGQVFERG